MGEFVGSIAVVITLIYLAIQIRQNTTSMNDTKKYMVAQTYQARSDALFHGGIDTATSPELCATLGKLRESGWPENEASFDALTTSEKVQIATWHNAHLSRCDNLIFQREQGLISDEYYAYLKDPLRLLGPRWRALGMKGRPAFERALDEFLDDTRGSGR